VNGQGETFRRLRRALTALSLLQLARLFLVSRLSSNTLQDIQLELYYPYISPSLSSLDRFEDA
jgi:hypothetical protein